MPRETDRFRIAVVGVLALALGASALTGAAAAQTDSPTIRVESATVQPGETATVDIVLTSAPNGLAGYAIDLSVGNSNALIEGANYPDTFGLTSEPAVSEDGSSVTLEAADLGEQIQPGATDVVLATVEVSSGMSGDITLSVEPLQFDADGGDSVNPASESGTVTVTAGEDTASTDDGAAADSSADRSATPASDANGADADADAGTGTTSTEFAFPAGGIVLTALALTLVAGFAARRR
jgi:hypothetical protein